ncbi:MAG: SO_0444 family Cu/Zn efflux transporter [Alteromonadaceae bacterium]|nr:SO_0444 family Cu/Zn efflux transporter [Alteromonadaceae bacterium]
MLAFVENYWELFLLSAPWLLFGLLVAAIMKVWVPMDWLHKQLGDNSVKSVVKGAVFGAPIPLCSCGVIPAAMQLRRNGASKGATVSFLSATPETGVDSIFVSYALLGPVMAIVRPVAAVFSAITAGVLVGNTADDKKPEPAAAHSCCSSTPAEPSKVSYYRGEEGQQHESPEASDLWAKSKQGINYATGKLLGDFYLALLIGLFFAALVQTLVPMDTLAEYGSSLWMMVIMVLISVPMYVCATSSTPLAAALMMMGVSPGAALVFMQAGPATNIATIGVVYKELGKRALAAYLFGVVVVSVFFGWLLNTGLDYFDISIQSVAAGDHSVTPYWVELVAAIVLLGLIARLLIRKVRGRSNG